MKWMPLVLALVMTGPASAWELSQVERPLGGASGVRETRWSLGREPGGSHDRIQVHRYRGSAPTRAVLLYLPGTNMNGHAAVTSENHNLWLFLARRGVEVWALDYRTHFVSPESSAEEHGFMAAWTLESFVEDARVAAAFARAESGFASLFVAGFSRGVTLAYALACVEPPGTVAGLVVLDGVFKNHAAQASSDAEARRAPRPGKGPHSTDVAGGIGWERRHQLMSAAASNPLAPSPDPAFERVGDQVSAILYGAWRPGGLADPVHGVSRVEVLARLLDGYDRYWPAIQNVEGRRLASRLDDPETPIDDAWGDLSLPILYFGATGMGPDWILDGIHSAVESGSEDVTLHVLEGYGHLDVLVGERAAAEVFEPTATWMLERAKR